MNFFARYKAICARSNVDPCSQKAADLIGTTRANISMWGKNKTVPKGETIAAIADAYHVSADYILCRTDDPTDYSDPDLTAAHAGAAMDALGGDIKKTVDFHNAVDADALAEINGNYNFIRKYGQLDNIDKIKIEAYLDGLLSADKYRAQGDVKAV